MNDLSWMLYLASVSGSINDFCGITFVVGLIVAIGVAIWGGMESANSFDQTPAKWALWRRWLKWTAIALAGSWLVGTVVPSRDTMYAIIASEMGEEALNSETGSKAVKALDAWLDRQINPPVEESE